MTDLARLAPAAKPKPKRKRPTVWEVMQIPRDAPIPDGWQLARQRWSHHSYWSKLVKRVVA